MDAQGQQGGKIIASGGFGCIFSPALKCKNVNTYEHNKISKLMLSKNAMDEYKQITQFKNVLNKIPNYQDYFLLDNITVCNPSPLTTEDLSKFSKKCKPLKKKGITAKNINQSLDKIIALNMPNGGIDLKTFVNNYCDNPTILIHLNNSLINLLVNGIRSMNALNVYHCDVKDTNILIKLTNERDKIKPRLIDWGISIVHNSPEELPRKLYKRPFQYNVPFSSVLFNKQFVKMYNDFLAQKKETPDYFEIREFVMNYVFTWNNIRGPGHLNTINKTIQLFTNNHLHYIHKPNVKSHVVEYSFTYYYIVEYLSKILKKYTINGNFKMMEYFNTVFIKNIDIWGFVMAYPYASFQKYFQKNHKENETTNLFLNKLKYIIVHYLYESSTEVINIDSLAKELTSLNEIIRHIYQNSNVKKQTKSKKKTITNGGNGKTTRRQRKIYKM